MKIQSMTGFGRGESSSEDYNITVEIKSVNHRFKDTRFKMSSIFSSIELDLKKELNKRFQRGSFDINITFKLGEKGSKFDLLDHKKISEYIKKIKVLTSASNVELKVSPCEFLRSEFYQEQNLNTDEILKKLVFVAFENAAEKLIESRLSEGKKMVVVIQGHLDKYKSFYQTIEKQADKYEVSVRERLLKRFNEFKTEVSLDEPRFLQEVVYYLEKLDVHEEINRIDAHLMKFDSIIEDGGEIGRQMDFLIQELNRETNTIGSKSGVKDISDAVVQMKVQLEKIREQGLNLE